jgi:hypothetical protein
MKKPANPALLSEPDTRKAAIRAARLARLRAIGRAEGVDGRAIDAAAASLAGAFALGDFMDSLRRTAGGDG